jgi:2-keto-4-pentenoate hydratase/2-oxohepta-3-ene-1,7-dioic acid hydratase in catechol pathway
VIARGGTLTDDTLYCGVRYLTFSLKSDTISRLGALTDEGIVDVKAAVEDRWSGQPPDSLLSLLGQGPDAWHRVAALIPEAPAVARYSLTEIRWHAPIPRPPKNVVCLGMNYAEHIREAAGAMKREVKIPSAPVYFTKAPTTVIGPFDEVRVDRSATQQVDWEAELGVIIGIGGRNIPKHRALGHVFGYTAINDVSARDLQKQHLQFFKGKSLDTFCPIGPLVVTADEFGDPQNKAVKLRVNGVTKQNGHTRDMIFPVDVIIESFSKGLSLEPGDIFSTGTPDGVGMGRTPQEWLQDGDVMETEIEGIGTMRNRIVFENS